MMMTIHRMMEKAHLLLMTRAFVPVHSAVKSAVLRQSELRELLVSGLSGDDVPAPKLCVHMVDGRPCGRAFQPDPSRRRNNRCPEHQAELDKREDRRRNLRAKTSGRTSAAWKKLRLQVLERDGRPGCRRYRDIKGRVQSELLGPQTEFLRPRAP